MRPYPHSILPAIACSLVSFLLLVLVTVSTPLWNSVYFLKLVTGPDEPEPFPSNYTVKFGVFGMSTVPHQLGYTPADWWVTADVRDPTVDQPSLRSITYALVLHPISAFMSLITFGFATIGLCSRAGAVFSTFSAGLATLVTIVVFIVDVVLFSILKSQFHDSPYDGRHTSYGPAIWMVLAALIACLVSLASAAFTAVSLNRYPRKWANEQQY
ncbi:SubName: Full=Uncharacterized protein {ECO:0000313/EMBL:CCA75069.1} [Serendipita indica DSM 11827]|nr:SubName: Full=Uncharacterized protein {ECO:0000313/EMBL:CCA75069.1} [Serendipita indica DSM 11827]